MNILVTGANGFVASNIIKDLECNTSYTIFKVTRECLNLSCQSEVKLFVSSNSIDHIIHCAIEGGKRKINDSEKIVYNNINIINNLLSCKIDGLFINIASGAEFDRRRNIFNFNESEIYNSFPVDYYGLSKNIIAKLINSYKNGINLRLFGCFNYNEESTRMIRSNITNYINKNPIIIHQDRYMDFLYIKDLSNLILQILNNNVNLKNLKDINVVYKKKHTLSDLANLINTLDIHRVPVMIENNNSGVNYCGNGDIYDAIGVKPIGLYEGLKQCYKEMRL
jgi:nucleoside-diphosphate-sugar epimerase